MAAPVNQFDLIGATEVPDRPGVEVDADAAQRRGLALHDGAAPKMGLQIQGMTGLQGDDCLAKPCCRLRPEPRAHRYIPH